jgi:outer membrane protein assembly factor BamB
VGLRALSVSLLLAALACGGGQTRGHPLDSAWSDEDGRELDDFQKSFRLKSVPDPVEAAIGVVDNTTLIGSDLESGKRWTYSHELESRPVLAGGVVVGLGGGELFALDVRSGEEMWVRKALGQLRGASDDGATTLVSLASLSGARSIVLAINRDGEVTRQIDEPAAIGAPVVLDAFAFLPYNGDFVVVFDLIEGNEAARVVSKKPVSRALLWGRELFFGEEGVLRFDDHVVDARNGAGSYATLPERIFPGDPQWLLPGDTALPPVAVRYDAVRYYARPEIGKGGAPRFRRYALGYYRIALGLSSPDARIRWAYTGSAPILGGAVGPGALTLCDSAGRVRWLDLRTGAPFASASLGESVLACAVSSERPQPKGWSPKSEPLADQLLRALSAEDEALTPMQLELLDELARRRGPRATAALLAIARRSSEAPHRKVLRERAEELLRARRSGLTPLVEAFAGGEVLPVDAVAEALGAHGGPDAAEALSWALLDPRRPPGEIVPIARALERIAGPSERLALSTFFARIRCDEPELAPAVLAVARALVRLGGASLVRRIARDACDHAPMQQDLQAAAAEAVDDQSRHLRD